MLCCLLPSIQILPVQLGPSGRHGVHAVQNVVRAKQKEAENVKVAQKDPDAVEKVHRRRAALRRNVQVSPVNSDYKSSEKLLSQMFPKSK